MVATLLFAIVGRHETENAQARTQRTLQRHARLCAIVKQTDADPLVQRPVLENTYPAGAFASSGCRQTDDTDDHILKLGSSNMVCDLCNFKRDEETRFAI